MPYRQVGDVLDRIRAFHGQLRRCYEAKAERQPDERMQLLLDYMARHERNLEACIAKFEQRGHEVRKTWIQNVPDRNVERAIEETDFTPEMTADEVLRAALALDAALIEFYRGLATSLVAPRVRELFSDLMELEKSKGKEHSKTVAQLRE